MSDDRPDEVTDPDDVRDGPQTSTNQAKTEAFPPSSSASTGPDFAEPSPDRLETPTKRAQVTGRAPVPSPGNLANESHVAVSTHAAQGTSEGLPAAEGVSAIAVAQPGKPDGEVAT